MEEAKYNLLIGLMWVTIIAIWAMKGLMNATGKEWLIFVMIVSSFLFCGIIFIKNYSIIQTVIFIFVCSSILTIGVMTIVDIVGLINIYGTFIVYITLVAVFIFDGAYFITATTLREAN